MCIDFFKLKLEPLRPLARTEAGPRFVAGLMALPSLTIGFSSGMSFSVKTCAAAEVAAATSDGGCTTAGVDASGTVSSVGGQPPVESADDWVGNDDEATFEMSEEDVELASLNPESDAAGVSCSTESDSSVSGDDALEAVVVRLLATGVDKLTVTVVASSSTAGNSNVGFGRASAIGDNFPPATETPSDDAAAAFARRRRRILPNILSDHDAVNGPVGLGRFDKLAVGSAEGVTKAITDLRSL